MNFVEHIIQSIDEGVQVDVVYTDFCKAFDQVNYNTLLRTMHLFGFSDDLIKLFVSYFKNRRQYVIFKGEKSVEYIVTSGVPQGSVLGPCLFIMLIDGITRSLRHSSLMLLFADDLKIFRVIRSILDAQKLQEDLDAIAKWAADNNLTFNVKKCSVVTFSKLKAPILNDYTLQGITLKRGEEVKDLALILPKTLSFSFHINKAVSKAYRNLGFVIRQSRNFQSVNTIKVLYFAYVRSILEYASVVWNPIPQYCRDAIEKVQKKFLRFLYYKISGNYRYDISYIELLNIFEMDSLEKRRRLAQLLHLHKILNNYVDDQFCLSQINFYVPPFQSRSTTLFSVPYRRTSLGYNSPINTMMRLYNKLPHVMDILNANRASLLRQLSINLQN